MGVSTRKRKMSTTAQATTLDATTIDPLATTDPSGTLDPNIAQCLLLNQDWHDARLDFDCILKLNYWKCDPAREEVERQCKIFKCPTCGAEEMLAPIMLIFLLIFFHFR